jgi:fructokinase
VIAGRRFPALPGDATASSMQERAPLFGAVELGGTKIAMAVGAGPDAVLARGRTPTTEPKPTLAAVADFFRAQAEAHGPLAAIGVGAFGPIVLDPADPDYGCLCPGPKLQWSGHDLRASIAAMVDGPVAMATDVAAAGVGEAAAGALRGIDCGIYLTVGTGIGAALIVHGRPLPALLHAEFGHLPLVRRRGDEAPSLCRFHDSCAEGLVSGPAIAARFGKPLSDFAADGPEVGLAAEYIGQLCASMVLAASPQRIVLGGGVAKTPGLHARAAEAMLRTLNGYATHGIGRRPFVVPPELGDDAGVVGGLALAAKAFADARRGRHHGVAIRGSVAAGRGAS